MPRWTRGEAEVEQLIARGELERVTGAAADGTLLLEQASKTAATAAGLVSSDAYSAYVLAYDSARFACIALLAQQGLRATTSGGHYAVEQAVRVQFGDGFRPFGALRRRRNELEYPHLPADTATSEEAEQAAGTAQSLITAVGSCCPNCPSSAKTCGQAIIAAATDAARLGHPGLLPAALHHSDPASPPPCGEARGLAAAVCPRRV